MRGETMKDKSKKSTYSTTFGVDPKKWAFFAAMVLDNKKAAIAHIKRIAAF